MVPYTTYVCEVNYQLVLVTKDKKPCLNIEMQKRLEKMVKEIFLKLNTELTKFTSGEYYIDMTIKAGTTFTAAKFINSLKTVTSRLLRKEFSEQLNIFYSDSGLWEKGYLFMTKSAENDIHLVEAYIQK